MSFPKVFFLLCLIELNSYKNFLSILRIFPLKELIGRHNPERVTMGKTPEIDIFISFKNAHCHRKMGEKQRIIESEQTYEQPSS